MVYHFKCLSLVLALCCTLLSGVGAAPADGNLLINEVMSSDNTILADEDGDYGDWIELINAGDEPVALEGWGLSDDPSKPFKWRMPAGILPPGALLVVYASEKNRSPPYTHEAQPLTLIPSNSVWFYRDLPSAPAISSDLCFWLELKARRSRLHTNFKISAGNESVILTTPDGITADTAPPLSTVRNGSYGRLPGDYGGAWLMFAEPTPGAPNNTAGYSGLLDPPQLSLAPGFYPTNVTVSLTHTNPAVSIYYTLDGSTPTNAVTSRCLLYSAPLTFDNRASYTNRLALIPTNPPELHGNADFGWMAPQGNPAQANILRAKAYLPDHFAPHEAAGTWFVGTGIPAHELPVFSLQIDEEHLFSHATGLWVPGDIYNSLGWPSQTVGRPNANYFQSGDEWERPGIVQMFEEDRAIAFTQLMGMRTHGGWSRAAAQKSIRLYARGSYYESRINHPLFPGQSYESYKRLLLRNSGNDWGRTGFCDALTQAIARPALRTDTQDYRPAVIYVNGEYWGVLNMREYYSGHYLARKYGLDPDNIDLLKAIAGSREMNAKEGDDLDYKSVLNYIETHDMAQAEHYAWVQEHMDLDNLIDHYATYIYFCVSDWPGNNLGLWRLRTTYTPNAPYGHDGRWRWIMYDTDSGFGIFNGHTANMMEQARRSSRGKCQPQFDRLLANLEFRDIFINRLADLQNSAFIPARMIAAIDATAARVESEIPRQVARWGRMQNIDKWKSYVQTMRNFANNRPTYCRNHVVSEFGLGGAALLTLELEGDGKLRVNTLTIDSDTLGLQNPAQPYPWQGTYFKSVPVTLKALPGHGSSFSHWLTPEGENPDPELVVTLHEPSTYKAVFETVTPPRIAINELMADASLSGGALHPVTGAPEDWFELINFGALTVDLSGYWLEDDKPSNACRIPDGVSLAPAEILLVWTGASLTPGLNPDGSLNATFGLGKKGDAVALLTPDRQHELDRVIFGQQESDVSQGRWGNGPAGAWVSFAHPTPGQPNFDPSGVPDLLPQYPPQQLETGQTLSLSFGTNQLSQGGVFALAGGGAGATLDNNGNLTWSVPLTQPSGVVEFRITWLGLIDGQAVTASSALLATIANQNHFRIATAAQPPEGGTVLGAGDYTRDAKALLVPQPAPGWRFARWQDGATTAARQVTVRRDATYTAQFAYGLLPPKIVGGSIKDGQPLLYWSQVLGADSYVVYRAATPDGPFQEIARTTGNVHLTALAQSGGHFRIAAAFAGTESESSLPVTAQKSGVTIKLDGTIIGTLGAWHGYPDMTREKVFDGDLNTFYDSEFLGGWPGLDLGDIRWRHLRAIHYAPRTDNPGRMVNAEFQISDSSDGQETFDHPETLHTVTSTPPIGQYTSVALNINRRFRYFRYMSPASSRGNIAELELYGHDTVPPAPVGLVVNALDENRLALNWTPVPEARGYAILRATSVLGPFTYWRFSEENAFVDASLAPETPCLYKVVALNGSGQSEASASGGATTMAPPVAPRFTAGANGSPAIGRSGKNVTLHLSRTLDPRLVLVCSDTLALPPAEWQPVADASITAAGNGTYIVSLATNAPTLFFSVRRR